VVEEDDAVVGNHKKGISEIILMKKGTINIF